MIVISFLKEIIGIFSIYAHPAEKQFDRLLTGLYQTAKPRRVRKKLLKLMQKNTVALQLWCERRYKGYCHLSKKNRKTYLKAADQLAREFELYLYQYYPLKPSAVQVLQAISRFLHKNKRFHYKAGACFSCLFDDPSLKSIKGDCNQMCTLYLFLYSHYFPIQTIRIKTFPGHVCLHFQGFDIETTTGQIRKYKKTGQEVKPIEDLVAINLIDISDIALRQERVLDHVQLEAHLLHFILGTQMELAQHNLSVSQKKEWVRLYKSMRSIKTIAELRAKKPVLLKMKKLADQLKCSEWTKWCNDMLKQV